MSGWAGNAGAPRVQDANVRRPNAKREITPRLLLFEDAPENAERRIAAWLANNGQARTAIAHCLPPNATEIERVTPVRWADNSVAYVEIRTGAKRTARDTRDKAYRTIFRGDVRGSDDPRQDGAGYCAGMEALSKHGLLLPTNVPTLIATQAALAGDAAYKMAVVWCEGEKTREAVEQRLERIDALDGFEALHWVPVTAATLGGMAGVRHTNYRVRPAPGVDAMFTAQGKNDVALELERCIHLVVLDADTDGRREGMALIEKLEKTYQVPRAQLFVVEPPLSAPEGWDDADPLPYDVSQAQRVVAFTNPVPYDGWWEFRATKNGPVVDIDSFNNRKRALRMAGISECFLDTSTGMYHVKGPAPWENRVFPNDRELTNIAARAVEAMGHPFSVRHLGNWLEPLESLVSDNVRDLIEEETREMLEQGAAQRTTDNRPENLFIRMFDLPDTEFLREAGRLMIRDILAMRLRPARNAAPLSPQLLFVFYGVENCGKSTAVKVLAGGAPNSVRDCPRYTDALEFGDLRGTDSHSGLQLYQKIAGMTTVEFADKPLGSNIHASRADMLKNFTNKGEITFRGINAKNMRKYNARCVVIFTTNKQEIMNEDMGSRRWIIIDTTQSVRPTDQAVRATLTREDRAPTIDETRILGGLNPGLNWVHENLPAMLAHEYERGSWRSGLEASPQMLRLMREMQRDYASEQSWEVIFENEFTRFIDDRTLGMLPLELAKWAEDRRRHDTPGLGKIKSKLRAMGWANDPQRVSEKLCRIWHHKTATGKDITKFLAWIPATPTMNGVWKVQDTPSVDHVRIMSAAADANEMPF